METKSGKNPVTQDIYAEINIVHELKELSSIKIYSLYDIYYWMENTTLLKVLIK